ncbi:MAG: 50S ribosomal protein L9, partial [Oscillospiraceae bacterium]
MKEVSDGYARNYLMPRGLASPATADAVNALKLKEKAKAAQMAKEKAAAEENAKRLSGVVVQISARAGQGGRLFGAVTSQEIAEALREQHGIEIEKNKIVQAEPIKQFGSYEVKAKLATRSRAR